MSEVVEAAGPSELLLRTLKRAWDRRAEIMGPCQEGQPGYEEARRAVLAKAMEDPVFFCDAFLWTYDPRVATYGLQPWVPFIPYRRQRQLLRWLEERRRTATHGAIPKSRGVGATFVCGAYTIWLCATKPDTKITWGSMTEHALDQRDSPDSVFQKLADMLERIPAWARDALIPGYTSACRRHRIIALPNGSTITGEIGDQMGRSGRSLFYFKDEAAYQRSATVDRAVLGNTRVLIDLSTPRGTTGTFAQKVLRRTVALFWMRHDSVPWQDAAWLERTRQEYALDPTGFAQEILCDFGTSDPDRLIGEQWTQYAVDAHASRRASPGPVTLGVDVATTKDRVVLVARSGPRVLRVESIAGAPGLETGRWVWGIMEELGASTICYDAIGVGEGLATYLRMMIRRTGRAVRLVPVIASAKPTRTFWTGPRKSADQLFTNLRAELWFTLRERFRIMDPREYAPDGATGIELLPHEALREELGWIKQRRTTAGKLGIERKDELRARQGASPDHADALMMAFADDVLRPIDLHMPTRQEIEP